MAAILVLLISKVMDTFYSLVTYFFGFSTTKVPYLQAAYEKKSNSSTNVKVHPNSLAAILFFLHFEGQEHIFQLGNSFFWIQHPKIPLEMSVTDFY